MTQDEIDDPKKIEFYAASVSAWYESSLEHDKSLLTLSAGGIGLLITLLTTVGLGTAEALVLYVGAITSFVVALISVLRVFRGNQKHIEDILTGKNPSTDPALSRIDVTAIWSFGLGVVFTAVIGISAAIHSFTTKEKSWQTKLQKPLQQSRYVKASMEPPISSLGETLARVLTVRVICNHNPRHKQLLLPQHQLRVAVESDFLPCAQAGLRKSAAS